MCGCEENANLGDRYTRRPAGRNAIDHFCGKKNELLGGKLKFGAIGTVGTLRRKQV